MRQAAHQQLIWLVREIIYTYLVHLFLWYDIALASVLRQHLTFPRVWQQVLTIMSGSAKCCERFPPLHSRPRGSSDRRIARVWEGQHWRHATEKTQHLPVGVAGNTNNVGIATRIANHTGRRGSVQNWHFIVLPKQNGGKQQL